MRLPRLQKAWNEAGKTDPYWAVLSDPQKKGNRWKIDEFFQTGISEIDALMRDLDALDLEDLAEPGLHARPPETAPPQYSPDGQWWWDGQRWIPTSQSRA